MIVAEAPPDPVREEGLTVQTGKSVLVIWTLGVTVQLKFTGPTNPLFATIATFDDEVPPGATAGGLKDDAVSVKS